MSALAAARAAEARETEFWGLLLSAAVVLVWGASVVFGFITGTQALTFIGLFASAVGLWKPGIGLIGVSMLSALDAFSRVYVFTGFLPWNTFNYFLLGALIVMAGQARRLVSIPSVAGAVFFVLLAVELLYSDEKLSGVQHLVGLASLFGLLLFATRAAGQPEAWVWSTIVTGLLGAGGGLVYLRFENDIAEVNKNAWAYLPLTALSLAAVTLGLVADRPRLRWVVIVLAAVNFGWVFLSASRGTFAVALVIGLYVIGASLRAASGGGRVRPGAVIGLVVALGVAGWVGSLVSERTAKAVERLTKLFDEDRSLANRTSGRSDLARIGWEIFTKHPFGVGTGEFVEAAASYGAKENLSVFHEGQRELQAHSAWVKTLAENGIPGIAAFAAFLASFAVAGWRRRAAGVFPIALLASITLALAFLSTEFQAKGLWLFAAAVIVVVKHASWRRDEEREPAPAERAEDGWTRRVASASR